MNMDKQYSSRPITISLGPTYSSDVSRIRNGQISWLDGLDEVDQTDDPIFTLEIPLELVDVVEKDDSRQSSLPSIEFVQCGSMNIHGVTPDPSVRGVLQAGRNMSQGIDSLFRSVVLADIDERVLLDVLQTRIDLDTDQRATLSRALLVPGFFSERENDVATQATRILKENIRQHECEHVQCLINPSTALWREIELYWRSILVAIHSKTWVQPDFLNRLATLYTTPSRFTTELLAMLTEDYTAENPAVQQAITHDVASRRGAEEVLIQDINQHNLDQDDLIEVLRSSTGEQFCDLWLAYVIDKVRSGYSLAEIDTADFHDRYNVESYSNVTVNSMRRTTLVDFMYERCLEPVCELLRLKFDDGRFILELSWLSTNPNISDNGGLLAVRRALYRRQFLSYFSTESGLAAIRADREAAIERIIRGSSLDDESLFDISYPSPEQLIGDLEKARDTAANTLLGPQMGTENLEAWLNDPDYGFDL